MVQRIRLPTGHSLLFELEEGESPLTKKVVELKVEGPPPPGDLSEEAKLVQFFRACIASVSVGLPPRVVEEHVAPRLARRFGLSVEAKGESTPQRTYGG